MRTKAALFALGAAMLAAPACVVIEVDFFYVGATSTTTTTTSSSSSLCTLGEARDCYSGPAGTEGVGLCRAGTQACASDGASWGACDGEVLPLPVEDCASGQDQNCDGHVTPCQGHVLWAKRFGNTGGETATAIATDAEGNVFVVGYFDGSIDFGGGPMQALGSADVFLVKLDPQGNHLWSRTFGGAGAHYSTGLAVDGEGSAVITGTSLGAVDFGGGPLVITAGFGAFVARFDASGGHVWSTIYGTTGNTVGAGVALDAAGSVHLTGTMDGSVDFGAGTMSSAGGQDVFVAKLDASGAPQWSARYGDVADQYGSAIAVDGAGRVLLGGTFSGTLNVGTAALTAEGADVFLAQLDGSGAPLWAKRYGGASDQQLDGLTLDAGGNALVAVSFAGTIDWGGGSVMTSAGGGDIALVQLDPSGAYRWGRQFSSTMPLQAGGVAADSSKNPMLVGTFSGTVDFGGGPLASAGGPDFFVAKLDAAGGHQWSLRAGDPMEQAGTAVATDPQNDVLVTGYFYGTMNFGNAGVLTAAGSQDVFVAKLSP